MFDDAISNQQETTSPRRLRSATWFQPSRHDACLAWGRSGQLTEALAAPASSASRFALLLDISHIGASVALDEVPHEDAGLWLKLLGDDVTEWTEARVVGMTITSRGPHLIQLAFPVPCGFETLKAAVCG